MSISKEERAYAKEHKKLYLYPGAKACIQCGYCCKSCPCAFGTWDLVKKQCAHLTADNKCGIYDQITARPVEQWYYNPAFGAGCCCPGNPDRAKLIKRLNRSAASRVRGSTVGDDEQRCGVPGNGTSQENCRDARRTASGVQQSPGNGHA